MFVRNSPRRLLRPDRTSAGESRRGFVLMVVLGLIAVMMAFGAWFFLTTVQSKNVFHVFLRADSARIIAESALAEWRAGFVSKGLAAAPLKDLLARPSPGNSVAINLNDLPRTQGVANSLLGRGNWSLTGDVRVHTIDDRLMEMVGGTRKRGTFAHEYQAMLRVQFQVGFPGTGASTHFSYDFDLKTASLRSRPADRVNQGYTTNALNDYVLYVRGAKNEFQFLNIWQQRNRDRTLTIAHASAAAKGKIFCGDGAPAADLEATGRFLFADPSERLQLQPPNPPLIGRTGPVAYHRFLPFTAAPLRTLVFDRPEDFFASPVCENGHLRLNGIYFIRSAGADLTIPVGTTYEGRGVIIFQGNIRIQGSFTKKQPTDGPCFLYTWMGNIQANILQQGRIEASLIALRYNYDHLNPNTPVSVVDFNHRKADVLGSLLVDRIFLRSMAANEENRITYDSAALQGDELLVHSVGGQLRGLNAVYKVEDN